MSSFRKALLWTAIPLGVLPLVLLAATVLLTKTTRAELSWISLIFLGPFNSLSIVALGVATVLYFAGRRDIGKGMAIGAAVGIVVIFLTDMAALALVASISR